jgi:hypothetical protein
MWNRNQNENIAALLGKVFYHFHYLPPAMREAVRLPGLATFQLGCVARTRAPNETFSPGLLTSRALLLSWDSWLKVPDQNGNGHHSQLLLFLYLSFTVHGAVVSLYSRPLYKAL